MSLKNRWALLKAALGSGQPVVVHTHLYLDGEEVRTVIADTLKRIDTKRRS